MTSPSCSFSTQSLSLIRACLFLPVCAETMDAVPQTPSFLHLHLGLDATGLGPLNCHYAVVDDWSKRESVSVKKKH